jgi:hypothetical protein
MQRFRVIFEHCSRCSLLRRADDQDRADGDKRLEREY